MSEVYEWFLDAIFGIVAEACAPNADWFKITDEWAALTTSGSAVPNIYNYVQIIGIGLTLVYFLMEMNQKLALEGRDLNMKSFFAPFLKLFIATVFIQFSGKIIGVIIAMGDNFLTRMEGSTLAGMMDEFNNSCSTFQGYLGANTWGFFATVFLIVIGLIVLLVGTILKLVWGYKAIMYKIELLFRVSVLPIAASDAYQGAHSNCIRYIKGFLAHILYGGCCVAIPYICVSIAGAQIASVDLTHWESLADNPIGLMLESCGMLVVAPFAAIAATSMIKQVLKEALA